ncbi:globin [Persicirhabdus sediminis]|uniref:Globin n=2 Tax=Persicirhabdus sediminis TaxID=454144 RepID=A0A8J7MCG1_9BACT|nr:globin [Persicirhabdus sediminis]
MYEDLGEEKLRELVSAFYSRIKTDQIIGKMYPDDDWEGSEERLLGFLIMRFGGPKDYLEQRGAPRLRMRHAPFKIGQLEANHWVKIMDEAMEEVELREFHKLALREFFTQVANFMKNCPM